MGIEIRKPCIIIYSLGG